MYRRKQFLQQRELRIKLCLSQANLRFEDAVIEHSLLDLIIYVIQLLRNKLLLGYDIFMSPAGECLADGVHSRYFFS